MPKSISVATTLSATGHQYGIYCGFNKTNGSDLGEMWKIIISFASKEAACPQLKHSKYGHNYIRHINFVHPS